MELLSFSAIWIHLNLSKIDLTRKFDLNPPKFLGFKQGILTRNPKLPEPEKPKSF